QMTTWQPLIRPGKSRRSRCRSDVEASEKFPRRRALPEEKRSSAGRGHSATVQASPLTSAPDLAQQTRLRWLESHRLASRRSLPPLLPIGSTGQAGRSRRACHTELFRKSFWPSHPLVYCPAFHDWFAHLFQSCTAAPFAFIHLEQPRRECLPDSGNSGESGSSQRAVANYQGAIHNENAVVELNSIIFEQQRLDQLSIPVNHAAREFSLPIDPGGPVASACKPPPAESLERKLPRGNGHGEVLSISEPTTILETRVRLRHQAIPFDRPILGTINRVE